MPDPERLLKTITRAVDASMNIPGRRGRFIDLADASEILVSGDLHGHVGHFQHLYKTADLANHPRRHLVLQEVVHGKFRYPLGGDKSHQLLDLFSTLKSQFPTRVHLLMGNHELAQWTSRSVVKADEDLNALFIQGVEEAYGNRSNAILDAYQQLFRVLPLSIRTPNQIFLCHSLPSSKYRGSFSLDFLMREEFDDEDLAPKGRIYSLLWGRDTALDNVTGFLQSVDADWLISGHIPCEQGFATPNERQFILDCCSHPAAYALLPTQRRLTREEMLAGIRII